MAVLPGTPSMIWSLLLNPSRLPAYQHYGRWGTARSWFDILIAYLIRKIDAGKSIIIPYWNITRDICWKIIDGHLSCRTRLRYRDIFIRFQIFFSKLTNFECLSRRGGVSQTYDIFHNNYKRPHHTTYSILNPYIETKHHLSTYIY